jgi:hypothetical protein
VLGLGGKDTGLHKECSKTYLLDTGNHCIIAGYPKVFPDSVFRSNCREDPRMLCWGGGRGRRLLGRHVVGTGRDTFALLPVSVPLSSPDCPLDVGRFHVRQTCHDIGVSERSCFLQFPGMLIPRRSTLVLSTFVKPRLDRLQLRRHALQRGQLPFGLTFLRQTCLDLNLEQIRDSSRQFRVLQPIFVLFELLRVLFKPLQFALSFGTSPYSIGTNLFGCGKRASVEMLVKPRKERNIYINSAR